MSITNKTMQQRSIMLPENAKYGVAFLAGLFIGTGGIPEFARGTFYMAFGLLCLFFAFQNNLPKLFALLPYLAFNEIIIRANQTAVPNLFAEYLTLAIFGLLILRNGILFRLYSRSFVFIFLFCIIEIIDSTRTKEPDFARLAITNSLLLFIVAFWSSTTKISIKNLNTFLLNLKIASFYLTAEILAIHIFGHVTYSSSSSFASSNNLAPVQVSAYLGLGSILFFLSIVNPLERKNMFFNIAFFTITTVTMILSFSRGGLYFLAVILIIYLIFNRKNTGSYFMLLMLAPVGFLIYYYVVDTTGGLIIDRYQQEGASGRDILVEVAFKIFSSSPLSGIGTGNFSKEIVARGLYAVESGAHNDLMRAAAEHGILGILTYWGFYVCMLVEGLKKKGAVRQYSIYFLALFCLIIIHNGLKISLQHILLVLVICNPILPSAPPPKQALSQPV